MGQVDGRQHPGNADVEIISAFPPGCPGAGVLVGEQRRCHRSGLARHGSGITEYRRAVQVVARLCPGCGIDDVLIGAGYPRVNGDIGEAVIDSRDIVQRLRERLLRCALAIIGATLVQSQGCGQR